VVIFLEQCADLHMAQIGFTFLVPAHLDSPGQRAVKRVCVCIVNIWNILPNSVVDTCTVNPFTARLGKFWHHQIVKFDFKADQTGTGNRSEEVIKR